MRKPFRPTTIGWKFPVLWFVSFAIIIMSSSTTTVLAAEERKSLVLRFFLVRHGETEANVKHMVVGQSDSVSVVSIGNKLTDQTLVVYLISFLSSLVFLFLETVSIVDDSYCLYCV